VLADLALRAVVAQEEITASDEEVDAEIARLAERTKEKPERVRRQLERGGALDTVRSDVARGKALEFLVDHATLVDQDGNAIDMSIDTSVQEGTSVDENTPAEHQQEESED
jgi:trigger factor